jgi:hypothetical protein
MTITHLSPDTSPGLSSASDQELSDSLISAKATICAALTDVMGNHGDILAERVGKAQAVQELRELLVSISPVVEAFGGRTALQGFIQRVGKIYQ